MQQCVVPNCEPDAQNYVVHRFPRSSFLYERWRQAIELGTGESFPKDVDPLEVVICQQHFTDFDGYQEPNVFRNVSLNRQIQLDCCRLCLKLDFSDRIAPGCGFRIVGETSVHDLLLTTFGIALTESDRRKGICKECLERLELAENTLRYFSKKNHRWNQMLDLIKGEEIQWHGNDEPLEEEVQELQNPELDITDNKTHAGNELKMEIEEANVQDSNSQDIERNEYDVTHSSCLNENVPLVQIPLHSSCVHFQEPHPESPSTSLSQALPSQSCEQASNIAHSIKYQSKPSSRRTAPSPHICPICSKSFTKAVGLREHLQIHQGTKNFKCQYCEKQFRTRKNWKIHETVHENLQAYTCAICSKTFTHPSNLKRHIHQLHAGAKDYVCNLCGRRFSRLNHLHVHLRAHSGEKPYQCPKCEGCFSTSSGLSKHRRNVCKLANE